MADGTGTADAGYQYVLLLSDIGTVGTEQVELLARGEEVEYGFDALDQGSYFVIAGTDMDNDGFICDEAEACGAYPVENDPVRVTVDGPVSGIDFTSVFRTGVQGGALGAEPRPGAQQGFRRRD